MHTEYETLHIAFQKQPEILDSSWIMAKENHSLSLCIFAVLMFIDLYFVIRIVIVNCLFGNVVGCEIFPNDAIRICQTL